MPENPLSDAARAMRAVNSPAQQEASRTNGRKNQTEESRQRQREAQQARRKREQEAKEETGKCCK